MAYRITLAGATHRFETLRTLLDAGAAGGRRPGRVTLQDEIGALLGARMSLMLLDEQPGLGVANSLGAYFTHAPRPDLTDACRNCVFNIRREGLPPTGAAHKLFALLMESSSRGLSGVHLKDETPV